MDPAEVSVGWKDGGKGGGDPKGASSILKQSPSVCSAALEAAYAPHPGRFIYTAALPAFTTVPRAAISMSANTWVTLSAPTTFTSNSSWTSSGSASSRGEITVKPALLMRMSRVGVRADTDAWRANREAGEVTSSGRVWMPRWERWLVEDAVRWVAITRKPREWKLRARAEPMLL